MSTLESFFSKDPSFVGQNQPQQPPYNFITSDLARHRVTVCNTGVRGWLFHASSRVTCESSTAFPLCSPEPRTEGRFARSLSSIHNVRDGLCDSPGCLKKLPLLLVFFKWWMNVRFYWKHYQIYWEEPTTPPFPLFAHGLCRWSLQGSHVLGILCTINSSTNSSILWSPSALSQSSFQFCWCGGYQGHLKDPGKVGVSPMGTGICGGGMGAGDGSPGSS